VGTCTYGVDYVDGTNRDGNGHGTHVAGTAAGQVYGVAKEANLIAVRVLNNAGSGSYSDIIAGVNWLVTFRYVKENTIIFTYYL
jgi:cerevisin